MELDVKITTEMLEDIQGVCDTYKGERERTCEKVQKWVKETIAYYKSSFEVKRIMEEFREKERQWHAQFKKGDIWKPKAWKCRKLTKKWCEYEPFDDPACDNCIHCGHPYERK